MSDQIHTCHEHCEICRDNEMEELKDRLESTIADRDKLDDANIELNFKCAALKSQAEELAAALEKLSSRVEDYACAGCIEGFGCESGTKPSLSDALDDATQVLAKFWGEG